MPDMDVLADCLASDAEPPVAAADSPVKVRAMAAGAATPAVLDLAAASVTAAQTSLSRMIGRGRSIALPGQDAELSLHVVQDEGLVRSDALVLHGAFGAIEVAQGVRFVRALTGIDISAELAAEEARWEWLQAALVARLDGTPFSGTERVARDALPEDPDTFMLRLTLRTAGHAVAILARADAASWTGLLQRGRWQRERLPFSEFADMPYETTIRVARHTLPRHALEGLAAGDLIVPDNAAFGTRGGGYIQFGILRARVRYQEPNAFRIADLEVKLDALELDDSVHDDTVEKCLPTEAAARPEEPDEPDDTPVTLDFELGKVRMSLGELAALRADSLVAFQGSPAAIAIRCGGHLLGRGELVDVRARLGIRILEWGPLS